MEANGRERRWGALSRAAAWRAGTFWEDMEGDVRVYIERDSERKEVEVEKRIEDGKDFGLKRRIPIHSKSAKMTSRFMRKQQLQWTLKRQRNGTYSR